MADGDPQLPSKRRRRDFQRISLRGGEGESQRERGETMKRGGENSSPFPLLAHDDSRRSGKTSVALMGEREDLITWSGVRRVGLLQTL